jgi:PAS domain S-box-containing protein
MSALNEADDKSRLVSSNDALSESELRFRLALKNAPVTVAVQDRDLRFIWAYNQRTIDPAAVVGKYDADIFSPEDAARLVPLKRKVIETGVEVSEKLWVTSNGKRVYLDVYLEPVRCEDGAITGIGIATVDLTQVKIAEEELKMSEQALARQAVELQANNEELARFNRAMVGREMRMIELKQEVNELCAQLGTPPRYATEEPRKRQHA